MIIRILALFTTISLLGCSTYEVVQLSDYRTQIVGTWKEKAKYSTVFDIHADGTFVEHYPHMGGCVVFDPSYGKWELRNSTLVLSYENKSSSSNFETTYKIKQLWSEALLFEYPNQKQAKFRRVHE